VQENVAHFRVNKIWTYLTANMHTIQKTLIWINTYCFSVLRENGLLLWPRTAKSICMVVNLVIFLGEADQSMMGANKYMKTANQHSAKRKNVSKGLHRCWNFSGASTRAVHVSFFSFCLPEEAAQCPKNYFFFAAFDGK